MIGAITLPSYKATPRLTTPQQIFDWTAGRFTSGSHFQSCLPVRASTAYTTLHVVMP
jgi:hypothetical protein